MHTFYRIIGMLVFTGVVTISTAQEFGRPHGHNSEKAKAMKVGVYTRVLDLNEAEAAKFWPVYNAFHDQQEKNRGQMRELMKGIQTNYDDLSDAEMEKMVDQMVDLKKNESELFAAYYENCKEVLPIKKVALIPKAEMTYKRELISEMKGLRGR